MELLTRDALETIALGKKIGCLLSGGMVILLEGDLGAGKTTFTKGIGQALEITKTINSPTFTIMKTYQGKFMMYHLDLYRLDGVNQEFDLEEYIDSDGISVIEWPNQAKELLPKEYLRITITILNEKRKFSFSAVGAQYQKILEELK